MALQCIIAQEDLYEGLNSLQNITNKKGTLAILLNVLIETTTNGIIITGTDLEVGLRIFVRAQVTEEGKLTLPSKKLFEIVRESGNENISIEEKDNSWVFIKAGQSTYNLAGMPSDEFPEFPVYDEDNFTNLESVIFQDLIEKTIYSVAGEQENVYTLTSILFRKEQREGKNLLKMISSDGHRLSLMEREIPASLEKLNIGETTLIPKKGVQEWKKFCDTRDNINISIEPKQLVVKDNEATMVIRLKDGEFPNYEAIINAVNLSNCVKIKRLPFLESLRRINLFTEDIFHTIALELDGSRMILTSQSVELGSAKDEMEVEYQGPTLKLGFNCRYFIDTLQVMECEVLEVYINSDASPCLLKSEEDTGFISIIMPMQL